MTDVILLQNLTTTLTSRGIYRLNLRGGFVGIYPRHPDYLICASILGRLSKMTSPTIFRLAALILSKVSSAVCQ